MLHPYLTSSSQYLQFICDVVPGLCRNEYLVQQLHNLIFLFKILQIPILGLVFLEALKSRDINERDSYSSFILIMRGFLYRMCVAISAPLVIRMIFLLMVHYDIYSPEIGITFPNSSNAFSFFMSFLTVIYLCRFIIYSKKGKIEFICTCAIGILISTLYGCYFIDTVNLFYIDENKVFVLPEVFAVVLLCISIILAAIKFIFFLLNGENS